MQAILPGRPQSKRQALATALWDGLRLVAYISGNAAVILNGPQTILQTIYVDTVEVLTAITIEETNGRIALCDEDSVYIYRPVGRDDGILRWVQVHELENTKDVRVNSLSWGSDEELLLGGSRLILWHIPEGGNPAITWNQALAYPTALAYLSPDSSLIASIGQQDRLVKIWRRLSYEVDSTRFDVSYLSHPSAVTNLHWRKPWHIEQNLDNLLYTFCSDNNVRIWTSSDPHALAILQHVGTINMNTSIQPRRLSVGSMSRRRFAFVIDSRDFSIATENAVQSSSGKAADHALEHLIEIANRSPEICVVLDGLGHMSVWGLENAGHKTRLPASVFHISHVDGMNVRIPQPNDPMDDYIQFSIFAGGRVASSISLLSHSYAGDIDWYDSPITKLFDTATRQDRAKMIGSLAGHSAPIKHMVRNVRGDVLLSITDEGHASLWKHEGKHDSAPLLRRSSFIAGLDIKDAVILSRARYVVILSSHGLELWDVTEAKARSLSKLEIDSEATPERITQTPVTHDRALTTRVIVGYHADQKAEAWELLLPKDDVQKNTSNGNQEIIRPLGDVHLHAHNKYNSLVTTCDNMSTDNTVYTPYELRTLRYNAVMVKDGNIEMIQAFEESDSTKPRLVASSSLATNIRKPSTISANGYGKVILVNEERTSVSIWDTKNGVWEYEHDLDGTDTVKSFAWAVTPNGAALVAICFDYHIVVLGQVRYSYPDSESAWVDLSHIRIRDFTTHSIGDLCWLNSGDLVVGSGIQFFVFKGYLETHHNRDAPALRAIHDKVPDTSTFTAMSMLNSNLAIFHPTYLTYLTCGWDVETTKELIRALYRQLKFFSEGDVLPSYLGFSVEAIAFRSGANASRLQAVNRTNGHVNGDGETQSLADIANSLVESLQKHEIGQLSSEDKSRLSRFVQISAEVEKQESSVDANGRRYLQALYTAGQDPVPWRGIAFASLSSSQEVLVDLVTRHYGGKLTWEAARKSGLFCWLGDIEALRTQMENVGRTEFTKNEDRSPIDCSLYYLALGKKNVLQGLWRMSIGVREKENTMKILANNFDEPRWKSTALKNAYALLSKRRFHYAAAWFLLGGGLWDAINVCVHQLKDLQLAVAVCRVYNDGKESVEFSRLIHQGVLQSALESHEGRWMASWAYSILGKSDEAIQVLVKAVHEVTGKSLSDFEGMVGSLNFQANDPLLMALYTQLRAQVAKQNRWRGIVSARDEWSFVMRNVRQYLRMGCDVLALSLVRNWEFVPESQDLTVVPPDGAPVRQLQRRPTFMDLEKEDDDDEKKKSQVTAKKKPPPTTFNEPTADSLLDSFGF